MRWADANVGREAFVGHDWVGPALATAVTLAGLLGQPAEASTLVLVGVAACFAWSAVARSLLATRRVDERRRAGLLRRTSLAQGASVLAIWAVLLWLGHVWPAVGVLVVGSGLAVLTWPWSWRLEQAADDRDRRYDATLWSQHLVAAAILLVLTIGSAVALGGVAWLMLLALVVSSVADAWDERRRPREGEPLQSGAVTAPPSIAPTVVAAPIRPASPRTRSSRSSSDRSPRPEARPEPAVSAPPPPPRRSRSTDTAEMPVVDDTGRRALPRQRDDAERAERSGGADRAAHRGGRRAQQRYRGRRVATRRR